MPEGTPTPEAAQLPVDVSKTGTAGGKPTATKEPDLEPVATASQNGHADRSAFLNLVGDLDETTVDLFDRDGKKVSVLVRELTGGERAKLITLQAEAYQKGSLEIEKYEREMLMAGVADPSSPEGARQPLLRAGDADSLMKLGASKTQELVKAVERLSGMGVGAVVRAEGNSGPIPSDDSISG